MNELLTDLLPATLPLSTAGMLLLLSLVTSMITASLGAGGGILLLAVLSITLPAQAIIPVHGLIQLGSNAGRASLAWRHIHWPTINWFVPGLLIGVLIGSTLLVQLPASAFQLIIALFVLYLCWGPALPNQALSHKGIMFLGAGTTFLTLFVGATGPLVSAFIKQLNTQRFVTVATIATALTLQHSAKIIVFGLTGFSFITWLPLIGAMILTGFIGTKLGLAVLGKVSDRGFQKYLNILLTVLALRLIWQAVTALQG